MTRQQQLVQLNRRIVACRRCARLVQWREQVAREKRRMFRDWDYWGRPVPGFGDPHAQLLVLGLAPAAHGANRTGRMFTGDRAGNFLYGGLHREGFASQPTSVSRDDGLKLRNCYITASLRCAPPQNKPAPGEQATCRPYLEEEFRLLANVRAVLALGRIAHDTYLRLLQQGGQIRNLAAFPFGHGAEHQVPWPCQPRQWRGQRRTWPGKERTIRLFDSFHPSQQNTQTGRLTPAMFNRVLREVNQYLRG